MDINFYSILLIISVINLFALIFIGKKKNITVYLLLYILITINLIGHYTISKAVHFETALTGHRLVYVGTVFTSPLWLLAVAKLCKIHIPKHFIIGVISCSMVILYLAYNVDTQTLYYSSVSLEQYNNYSILVKENGPLHILYPLMIVCNMFVIIAIICHTICSVLTHTYSMSITFSYYV